MARPQTHLVIAATNTDKPITNATPAIIDIALLLNELKESEVDSIQKHIREERGRGVIRFCLKSANHIICTN